MLTFDRPPWHMRLTGDWYVRPVPFESDHLPNTVMFQENLVVPECAHLQTILFPDRPYWGDHLRAINHQTWVYRRTFQAPEVPYRRARLRFDGVDYFASVWLNGRFIGEHEGAFVPFTLDITDAYRPGEANTLLVRVSSPWDMPNPRGNYPVNHVIRGMVKGLYEHGEGVIPPHVNPLGIWRPVWLLLDDGLSLDRVRIQTELDGTVHLEFTATNATGGRWAGSLAVNVAAENHDGPGMTASLLLALEPGTQTVTHRLRVPEARLWWPWDHGEPNLYRLTAVLRAEGEEPLSTLDQTFGIRTVRLDRAPDRFTFWINERPVFVRGTSYMPGVYLSQHDRDSLERDVSLARQANLNLLRVHVHVSPPELYDLCNRAGMLIWQDFELHWVHDSSPEFEARALALQRDMIDMLGNHPSIIAWSCHNEPTMLYAHRDNYERHPDPALYADAVSRDPTRPVFICSGQMENDWQRAGDAHTYYGALWTRWYTDVYRHRFRLNTEFGFEAPAALGTLQKFPDAWKRLQHLDGRIERLWAYQAALIQFHVEHLRRTRAEGCAGYIHFWLVDLVPQVGCGVLDSERLPKGGYEALRRASQPLLVALEHDGRRPRALWVFNDTPQAYPAALVCWQVFDGAGRLRLAGEQPVDVAANASQRVADAMWSLSPVDCGRVELALYDSQRTLLAHNTYERPLQPLERPRGYPWKFDPYLGFKVFDRPDAPSLADQSRNPFFRLVPLPIRERLAEWGMRQQLPPWLLSVVARMARPFVQR